MSELKGVDLSEFRALYPFASRWHALPDGARMHYVDVGEGHPIVMVHGNPTWSCFYRGLINGLSGDFRCLAPDHVGCGLSDKPSPASYAYTLERRVTDLEHWLDTVVATRATADSAGADPRLTLIVHDWGGMIGCAAALRNLDRVARLVVLNTAAFLLPPGKDLPWELEVIRNAPWFGAPAVLGGNLFARAATQMTTVRPLPDAVKRLYLAPYDSWRNRIATLRFVQDIPTRPGDPSYELARWVDGQVERLRNVPTLICWGAQDFVFDREFYDEWRRRLPHAEAHLFEDAGHYVLEDAGDRVLERVRTFLRHTEPR